MDPALLLKVLRSGEIPLFEALFAEFSGIQLPRLQHVLYETGGKGLAVVCKALDVDKTSFTPIYLLSRKAESSEQVVEPKTLSAVMTFFTKVRPPTPAKCCAAGSATTPTRTPSWPSRRTAVSTPTDRNAAHGRTGSRRARASRSRGNRRRTAPAQRDEAAALRAELARTRARLDDISRLVSDWIWEIDRDLRISSVTPRVMEALGTHPMELVGRPFSEVVGPDLPIAAPGAQGQLRARPFRDQEVRITDRWGHAAASACPACRCSARQPAGSRATAAPPRT